MIVWELPDPLRSRIDVPDPSRMKDSDALSGRDPIRLLDADILDWIDKLNDEHLLGLGLPLRPDPTRTPQLYDLWKRMLPREAFVAEPRFGRDATVLHRFGAADSGLQRVGGRRRWGASRNWSGGVLHARDGKLFTSVAASWKVPAVEGFTGDTAAALPGGNRQVSVWVGLDGHRGYSRSLPQIGTRSMVTPNPDGTVTQSYHLWVQWWVRGELFGEVAVQNFPLAKDDEIHVKLDVIGETRVRFTAINRTQGGGVGLATDWQAGETSPFLDGSMDFGPDVPLGLDLVRAPVEGRHAVFCVERPSVLDPAAIAQIQALIAADQIEEARLLKQAVIAGIQPYGLPAFKSVVFTEALAEMRLPDGDPATAEERDLLAARQIRLGERLQDGGRPYIQRLATPKAPCDGRPDLTVERVGLPA